MRCSRKKRKNRNFPSAVLGSLLFLAVFLCLSGVEDQKFSGARFEVESSKDGVPEDVMCLVRTDSGKTEKITTENYVIGVVAGEMPVEFEPEALKSQAVIARTYAVRKIFDGEKNGDNVVICDDPGHCQAFSDMKTLREQWGNHFDENYEKIKAAVSATKDQYLYYEGEPARTYYHSVCGGHTASAKEVWGEDIPYLRGVNCEWDSDAPHYCETVTVAGTDLPRLFRDAALPCVLSSAKNELMEMPALDGKTESGRVASVFYGGTVISAVDFRRALNLNSTCFTLSAEGNELKITTKGFGHGVGLCQYGANGMAKEGYTYGEILAHYYPGTELKKHP